MSGCPVLWCERSHASPESPANACHYVVLQHHRWTHTDDSGHVADDTALCASLSWQENSERGPYIAVEATGGGRDSHLVILSVGVADALAELFGRDPDLYGEGGRFLAESIGLGTDILA